MKNYTMSCGCSWPIIAPPPKEGALPILDVDVLRLPDCVTAWDLMSEGTTKGVFQLESRLGSSWAKRLKPRNNEHLSALGALLRPGCLAAKDDNGVSMTEHYCRRVNGEEVAESFDPALDEILGSTEQILVYQEQAMQIGAKIAGFDLKNVDRLRKAIGKKDQREMSEVKKLFVDGAAQKKVVSEDMAATIWGWIEKSGRYSFNKCVSFDTAFLRPNGDKERHTVEELFFIKNDIEYARVRGLVYLHNLINDRGHYGSGFSLCNDGRIVENIIRDIRYSGHIYVLSITTESGAKIRVTHNHKFPTSAGIKKASDLRLGDDLYSFCWGQDCSHIEKILLIEDDGECNTYDVTMDAPNHNFVVSSGIVTCNSHSMSYGLTGYDTAYLKSHFPVQFYTSWLCFAEDKIKPDEEVMELVEDARRAGVPILPPDLRSKEMIFHTDGISISFGLGNIKGLGENTLAKMFIFVEGVEKKLGRPLSQWTWLEWVLCVGSNFLSATQKMIMSGAMDWSGVKRQKMLAELEVVASLTDIEIAWMIDHSCGDLLKDLRSLARTKKDGGGCANAKRVSLVLGHSALLEKPPTPLNDNVAWMAWAEEQAFGFSLTCSRVDACDLNDANTTVGEFLAGKTGFIMMGVEIRSIRIIKTKKGTEMAFLSLVDSSGVLDDVVCFSEPLEEYRYLLTQGNTVLVQGERDPKKNSFVLRKVFQLA
jgi:DNA polymerase III alpha subunit